MSCTDSEVFKEEKSFSTGDMGDVLGKESDETEGDEVSQEYKDFRLAREDADGAPSVEEKHATESCDLLIPDEGKTESAGQEEKPCTCDACKEQRQQNADSVEEMRRLQAHWMELRQYIRGIYRMAMEGKTIHVQPYQPHIRDLVHKLCVCDPHQLFQRLEAQVQEFVIEAKVRQLELLHKQKETPDLSRLFITGLLDSYKKLMSAATQLAPLLDQLQIGHLNKFNVTWKVLNQHLYQSCVYTDPLVLNNVPHFISELSKSSENIEMKRKLVHDFLSFDDEITLVGGMWREVETRIHQYNQEQAELKAKQRMLKEDWELFKAQRKMIQQKMWNKSASELCEFEDTNVAAAAATGAHRGCPCDECSMSQLLACGGLVTPPLSPALSFTGLGKTDIDLRQDVRTEGEGREEADESSENPSCECHVCTAPPVPSPMELEGGAANPNLHGGGFHLYPHIHGTGGGGGGGGGGVIGGESGAGSGGVYPHLYNIHTSLLAGKHPHSEHDLKQQQQSKWQTPPPPRQQPAESPHHPKPVTRPDTPPPPPPLPLPLPPASKLRDVHSKQTNSIANGSTIKHIPTTGAATQRTHRHSTTQTPATTSEHHPPPSGHSRLHQSLPDAAKAGSTPSQHPPHSCHKHAEPIKRVACADQLGDEDDSTSPEDSCSERSTSTQRDSRHCDCCYCEVFGHGVPSVAPVSRNYQEMRERLRQLLTKKKAKCKAGNGTAAPVPGAAPAAATASATAPAPTDSVFASVAAAIAADSAKPLNSVNGFIVPPEAPKDPRDLEDLLDFIEGNPGSKCKDAKKAAKKARQKQKKQEELDRKKREEEEAERRRRELIIQQQKQEAALLRKQQQLQLQQQKQNKKGHHQNQKGQNNKKKTANHNTNNNNNHHHHHNSSSNSNNSSSNNNNNNVNSSGAKETGRGGANAAKSEPQMVTIKRVMEPNGAEPTVTITLRGATPNEDKVLYTLLNGQVCQVPKDAKNAKSKNSPAVTIRPIPLNKSKSATPNNNNNNVNTSNKNTVHIKIQQQPAKKGANGNGSSNNSNSNNGASNNSNNKTAKKEANNGNSQMVNGYTNGIGNNRKVLNQQQPPPQQQQHPQNYHHPYAPPPVTPAPQLTSPTAIQINNAINRLSSRPAMPNFNLDNLKLPPGITITKVDPATVQPRRPVQVKQASPPPPAAAPPKPAASNVIVVDTGKLKDLTCVPHNDYAEENGKKKKNKNKKVANGGGMAFAGNSSIHALANNNMVTLTMNGAPSSGGPLLKQNGAGAAASMQRPQNGKVAMPQAAIIKVNGSMVTIRSPALQQALASSNETGRPGGGGDQAGEGKKKKKKKKGANGQGHPDEWNLVESVFAPKDIDLDNGDIDDAERELEAFKRFCLQSVPPKRKEKVHLNIKDIVLKKKGSAISCS